MHEPTTQSVDGKLGNGVKVDVRLLLFRIWKGPVDFWDSGSLS